jgi:hypothetical protein
MTNTITPEYVQNQHVATPRKTSTFFQIVVIALLSVIALSSLAGAYIQHTNQSVNVDTWCLGLEYDYAEDGDSSDDFAKQNFSDLNAEDRAVADRLGCDIEGR